MKTKSRNEIINLANTIKNEVDNLPEENAFGEDNTEIIEEGEETYRDLYRVAAGDEPQTDDVKRWVNGESSELDVYS